MTGFELAQLIKERKKTARIPIIFLTAYYNEDQHVLEGYGTRRGRLPAQAGQPGGPALQGRGLRRAAPQEPRARGRQPRAARPRWPSAAAPRQRLRELNETLDQRVQRAHARRCRRARRGCCDARPPQGRVPGHAGARAAQSAGAGAQRGRRSCSAQAAAAAECSWATDTDRPPGAVAAPPDRRPDGRQPHQPGPHRAAARGASRSTTRWSMRSKRCARMADEAGHELAVLLPDRQAGGRRRPHPAGPGLHQPAEQRGEVHRARRPHRGRRDRWSGAMASVTDPRQRHRHPAGPAASRCSRCSRRSRRRSTRSRGGLGIGLSLTRQLVRDARRHRAGLQRGPGPGQPVRHHAAARGGGRGSARAAGRHVDAAVAGARARAGGRRQRRRRGDADHAAGDDGPRGAPRARRRGGAARGRGLRSAAGAAGHRHAQDERLRRLPAPPRAGARRTAAAPSSPSRAGASRRTCNGPGSAASTCTWSSRSTWTS